MYVNWQSAAITGNQDNVQIRKNGSAQNALFQTPLATGTSYTHGGTNLLYFNGSTDYIEFTAYTSNTTNQVISGGIGVTFFTATLYAYGQSGTSGYSGISGYSGSNGESGISGYSGQSGYSGFSGISGYSGFSGISGYSGFSGYSGISGYSGFSGQSGYSGFSGISGYSGQSGYSGWSGISGYSGVSGYSGIGVSGYSGIGVSGYSGYSGYSGLGLSGYSGYSGSVFTWTKKTSSFTAVSNDAIIADTSSGPFTATLPATPTTGATITFVDGGNWAANNLTIARNSSTIEGLSEDLIVNISGIRLDLVYDGTTWQVYTLASPSGVSVTNDLTTNSTFYPVYASSSSANGQSLFASSSKLTFNPSTGTLGATDFNSLSDRKFKENITPILDAISTILKLNAYTFTWKENGIRSYGVIAQELEQIIPEIVVTNDMGIKGVNYSSLIAFLIQAIKEQQKQIDVINRKIGN